MPRHEHSLLTYLQLASNTCCLWSDWINHHSQSLLDLVRQSTVLDLDAGVDLAVKSLRHDAYGAVLRYVIQPRQQASTCRRACQLIGYRHLCVDINSLAAKHTYSVTVMLTKPRVKLGRCYNATLFSQHHQ